MNNGLAIVSNEYHGVNLVKNKTRTMRLKKSVESRDLLMSRSTNHYVTFFKILSSFHNLCGSFCYF